ncbi:ankyrin repeat-containing domain protein, partial [Podospora conica]
DFYAILESVASVGGEFLCPAITLRRLSLDQFARLQNRAFKFFPPPSWGESVSEADNYRTIYVRQNPVSYHIPYVKVSPQHSAAHAKLRLFDASPWSSGLNHYPGYTQGSIVPPIELLEAFPSTRWDAKALTMSGKYSKELQAMALFRFQDNACTTSSSIFDVVVGLRWMASSAHWEGSCFQISYPRKDRIDVPRLASVFKGINERIQAIVATSKPGMVSALDLRESLGDDEHLVTDARMAGMDLQGRLYFSVSVSTRPEVHGECVEQKNAHRFQLAVEAELKRPPRIRKRRFRLQDLNDAARLLTGPCAKTFSTLFEEPDEETIRTTLRLPVRGIPKTLPADAIKTYLKKQSPLSGGLGLPTLHIPSARPPKTRPGARLAVDAGQSTIEGRLALAVYRGQLPSRGHPASNSVTEDEYRLPILHWAIAGRHENTIRYLLQRGANAGETARYGLSIVHIMALFREGPAQGFWPPAENIGGYESASSRTTGFYKEAPLHLAAASRGTQPYSVEVLQQISVAGHATPRNALDETPIHRAAALNNAEVIRSLVPLLPPGRPVDDVDCYGRTPLWHAAATGSKDSIDILIALGASVNLADDLGVSPLHAACRGGYVGCVVQLVNAGANPCFTTSKLDLTPLDLAAMFGHRRILDRLCSNKQYAAATLTQRILDRSLHIAASCGYLKCVKILIAADADPGVSFDYYFRRAEGRDYAKVTGMACNAREAAAHRGCSEVAQFLHENERGTLVPQP